MDVVAHDAKQQGFTEFDCCGSGQSEKKFWPNLQMKPFFGPNAPKYQSD